MCHRYCFCTYRPVHGLIFLFRWIGEDKPDGPIVKDTRSEKIFFAQQVCIIVLHDCILLP